MNPNKLTTKAQEALQGMQQIAQAHGHQALEPEHDLAKLPWGNLVAGAEVADLRVLAENAGKVAGAEKNRARAARADKRPLFSEVGPVARHEDFRAEAALPPFSLRARHATAVRAEAARRKTRLK